MKKNAVKAFIFVCLLALCLSCKDKHENTTHEPIQTKRSMNMQLIERNRLDPKKNIVVPKKKIIPIKTPIDAGKTNQADSSKPK